MARFVSLAIAAGLLLASACFVLSNTQSGVYIS